MNRYILKYPSDEAKKPILAEAILKTGVLVNILAAEVDYSRDAMVIAVIGDKNQEKKMTAYLRSRGVDVEKLEGNIVKDDRKCVDCCACYGVCPTKAITIKDMRMVLNNDECIRCKACVEACPTRALKIQ